MSSIFVGRVVEINVMRKLSTAQGIKCLSKPSVIKSRILPSSRLLVVK